MNKICIGLIIVVIIFIMSEYQESIFEYMSVTTEVSPIDDRSYNVIGGFTDKKKAAKKLSELHMFIIDFLRYLRRKFIINKNGSIEQQQFIGRVLKNYNPDVLHENDPGPGEETSYVMNKGQKFGLCLRNKNPERNFIDKNLLQFVIIHEMSHLGTTTYGHNREFWFWFKFLLVEATESKLYIPIDYGKHPTNYCGLSVKSNPYFQDATLYPTN